MTIILGKDWYSRLNRKEYGKSVLDVYSPEDLEKKFLISLVVPPETEIIWKDYEPKIYKEDRHFFRVFDNYTYFFKYLQGIPIEKRWFHEVILPNDAQKPRFDIDISYKQFDGMSKEEIDSLCETIFNSLIEAIVTTLNSKEIKVTKDDFIIFDSSGKSDENYKYSKHIIIHTFYHSNPKEAQFFHDCVIQTLLSLYPKFKDLINDNLIDPQIYKSKQNFRLPEAIKSGKSGIRQKRYVKEWKFCGEIVKSEFNYGDYIENLQIFSKGIIRNIHGCRYLSSFKFEESKAFEAKEISSEVAIKAINLCISSLGYSSEQFYEYYEISEVKSGLICLKRLQPTICKICCRCHEAENPFISISNQGNVYFNCRRNPKGKWSGNLDNLEQKEDIKEEEEYAGIVNLLPKDFDILQVPIEEKSQPKVALDFSPMDISLMAIGSGLSSRKTKMVTNGKPVQPKIKL